jgi:hypothetical protein
VWDKSPTAGNLPSGFIKYWIYSHNADILAEDVFKYQPVAAVNGDDGVRLAEVTADPHASTSSATFLEELSPVPKITFPSDPSI